MADTTTAGGFLPPLPSPAPSIASTATPSLLPRQRSHPLKAGSMKETSVINYLDNEILSVNRKHAKKFSSAYEGVDAGREQEQTGGGEQQRPVAEAGYESFREMVRDIEGLIDVLWVSGTPTLQIPYTISLAVLTNSSLPDYPFTPRSTFRLLHKLDSIFASLLTGEDADTGAVLPGFETRRGIVSMTEKVRIKSIAEGCRMVVMEVREMGDDLEEDADGGDSGEEEGGSDDDEEMEDVLGDASGVADANVNVDGNVDGEHGYGETAGRWEMEAARVYERTIQLLGDELGRQGFGEDIADT